MSSILKVDEIQDTSGNNIINENANTVTIGKAGDTVNVVGTLQSNGTAVPTVSGGLVSQQVFTSSGTWTKPSGINLVKVYVTGGGAGGGWSGNTANYSGGGGGAGGTAIEIIDVSSVSSVAVTVSGTAAGGNSVDFPQGGGTSSFGSYCSASGGTRGNYGGGLASEATGGVGSNGDINLKGGDGQGGSEVNAYNTAGKGGDSFWSGGGCGDFNNNGLPGTNGSGGGGGQNATAARDGGQGGAGIVVVEEYK